MESVEENQAKRDSIKSDLEKFEGERNRLISDFNDYTKHVRSKSLELCILIIIVNWAVFGKLFENGSTFIYVMDKNYDIKRSIFCAISGVLVNLIYNYFYSIYLAIEDKRIQKDFEGDKKLFSKRLEPSSSYPYAKHVTVISLAFDFFIMILSIGGFYYFFRSIGIMP